MKQLHAFSFSSLLGLTLSLIAGVSGAQPVPIPSDAATATVTIPGLELGTLNLDGSVWHIAGSAAGISAVTLTEGEPSAAIPLGRKAGFLDFLQVAEPGSGVSKIEEKGKVPAHPPQVFGYELTYEDGSSLTLHMDWRHHVGPLKETFEKAHYYSSWPVAVGDEFLYHARVPNPWPDKMIRSVRMVPPEKGEDLGQPYLIALGTTAAETVAAGGVEWALADYNLLHGPSSLTWDTEAARMGIPMHGKSDRGALAYVTEPFTGDFKLRLRLVDLPMSAAFGFFALTVSDRVGYCGRGGVDFSTGIYFKPAREQDLAKKGIFYLSAGKPVVGEILMAEGKPVTILKEGAFADVTPVWLELERKGHTLITRKSANGTEWKDLETKEYPDLPEPLYVSIYTALSHGPQMMHAHVDGIQVTF